MMRAIWFAVACWLLCSSWGWGQESKTPTKGELYQQLEATLTNSKFVGQFTIAGKEQEKPSVEEYWILSAKKAEFGETWLLTVRVKYGDKDITLPMPLVIEWAGTTPVITLEKTTLPGLGTFSSRVVIHDGRYAGTWQHDAVGGHLFGKIEKVKAADDAKQE